MKNIIEELLAEQYQSELPDLFRRPISIPSLPKNIRKALVFIGMRRVGKTFLMYQHMEELLKKGWDRKELLYLNFEDDRLSGFQAKDFQTILDVYFEQFPEYSESDRVVFYFDEIQNIDGWEKFIRRLIDKEKMTILITGSSAKSLSRDIATSLRGRSLSQEVFPLGFSEYLAYRNVLYKKLISKKEEALIKKHLGDYLFRGGFPEILDLSVALFHQTIQSYVHATVFRDVIDRYDLSNPHIVKLFLIHCLQNIASPLSVTKIYKTLRSRGESLSRNSLYSYLEYFEDAFLICSVPIFDLSTRKRQVNPIKIYTIDTGIISSYSLKPEMEHAARLENAVYIELRKKKYETICYYLTQSRKEVDFICQTPQGALELYQVSIDVSYPSTKEREVSALIEAAKELNLKQGTIVTLDHEETMTQNDVILNFIPFWKWTLFSELSP
ncbi:MAG: ATP-binding protein [Chlamydiales bacterium]|nr:ATP-binding protein [Chlamydiales bacterium]